MLRDECDRAGVDEFKPRDAKGSARHRTLGRDVASIRWSPLVADNASCSAASSASLSWPADGESCYVDVERAGAVEGGAKLIANKKSRSSSRPVATRG